MYYDEEKKSKKVLYIIVAAIVVIILLIIIWLLMRGGDDTPVEPPVELTPCVLMVTSDTVIENGVYKDTVVVSMEYMNNETYSAGSYGIGLTETEVYNQDSYITVEEDGPHTVYGYVKYTDGSKVSCKLDVEIKKGSDECVLEVTEGTLGENDWYVSNATVGFKEIDLSSEEIESYGIIGVHENTNENPEPVYNTEDSYIVKNNGKTNVYGFIQYESGTVASCSIEVKKDVTKPTCMLEVTEGTKSGSGYTGTVKVGLKQVNDEHGEIDSSGVGIEENYTDTEYTITKLGKHTIKGYVKDKAGNKNTCSLTINVNDGTIPDSVPKCTLKVQSGTSGTNGWYKSDVVVQLASKSSTSGATITSYGIGTSKSYNSKTTYKVNKDGSTTVYGYVKDSNGNESTCSLVIKRDTVAPECSLKVTSGTYNETSKAYTTNVTVGFNTKTDATSSIAAYGLGTSKDYNSKTSYQLTSSGKVTGYVKDSAGNENVCTINITISKAVNLAEKVSVGDYVAYDAGKWTTTVVKPTLGSTAFSFGGYTSGSSRNNSVNCGSGAGGNGWRVLSKTKTTVTLVHAGTPECFFHPVINGQTGLSYNSAKILSGSTTGTVNSSYSSSARDWSIYVNKTYATSATVLTKNLITSVVGIDLPYGSTVDSTKKLGLNIGVPYYLGTAYNNMALYGLSASGKLEGYSLKVLGVRPVVTLKENVKTTGKNSSGAWVLTN